MAQRVFERSLAASSVAGLARMAWCAGWLASLVACSSPPPPAVEADASAEASPPVVVAPLGSPARDVPLDGTSGAYPGTVGHAVDYAVYMGMYTAVSRLAGDESGDSGVTYNPAAETRPKGTLLTLFFTANVDGEREDCGCKKNPMGGLTRKAHVIKGAGGTSVALEQPDAVAVVDAGNLLFANGQVQRLGDKQRQVALIQAEAIVESFNAIGCEAFAVGQNDLAMGLETLQGLRRKATFPWVSANLKAKGRTELLFEPFVVRELGGRKVAFVGLIEPEATPNYYQERGVEVLDPAQALKAQGPRLAASGADTVVLLSNLGVTRTQSLLDELGGAVPVHAVVVSGTRRSTYQPIWTAAEVPMVEPGSRGKHLGRLDLHIVDGGVAFDPGRKPFTKVAAQYLGAYRSLHNARRSEAEGQHEGADAARMERYRRNLEFAVKRLRTVEAGLPGEVKLGETEEAPRSWLRVVIAPLPIELPQDPAVRSILDKHQKRVEKIMGPLPAPGGGH